MSVIDYIAYMMFLIAVLIALITIPIMIIDFLIYKREKIKKN